jgi:hypothetical protein
MNTSILSTLTGLNVTNPRSVIDQGFVGNNTETACCKIKTSGVYSICDGTVIAVERSPLDSTWTITVEVDSQLWLRYCGLRTTGLLTGVSLHSTELVGYPYNSLLRFEYCTSAVSKFPVRVATRQLYKQDPTPILFGQIPLDGGT